MAAALLPRAEGFVAKLTTNVPYLIPAAGTANPAIFSFLKRSNSFSAAIAFQKMFLGKSVEFYAAVNSR